MPDLRKVLAELDKVSHSVASMRKQLSREISRQRRFAADASHELRTPIAGLRAQLEEARLNPGETDLESLLDRTLSDVERLQAIVSDLFVLAHLEASTVSVEGRPLSLAELVRTEVSRLTSRDQIRLRLQDDVIVDVVASKISRVLSELLDNAQRHAERTVQVEVLSSEKAAMLIVSDDGEGITKQDRRRIFDRFARLDAARCRDHGGTGLGLAIARDIVHAHHGTIHVEDSPLGGACFIVRLPLVTVSRQHPDPG